MKYYEKFLKERGFNVYYIEAISDLSDIRNLIPYLNKKGVEMIYFIDPVDNWLEKRIVSISESLNIKIKKVDSPSFINTSNSLKVFFGGKNHYLQTSFYIQQRRNLNLLISDGKPQGGKWTFDKENRQKIPKNFVLPKIVFPQLDNYYQEAIDYIEKNFSSNYGSVNTNFLFPYNFTQAKNWFRTFLVERLCNFGKYQDAIIKEENVLHHSLISPLLNSGLLTPLYVVSETLKYFQKNEKNIPINSVEGFIRQIIGWREFIRGVYEYKGSYQRTRNFWNFKNKLPNSFWYGTTKIEPVDLTIIKVLNTAYCHHIERLMILGNFMLLCEINPNEVYKWFMTLFIDSYDWVMVPNVYGMSQFADGGVMSTKPYISSSNYLMKMSNYQKGKWQEIWDGLFWRFIVKYKDFFDKNIRLGILLKNYEKMPSDKKKFLMANANQYIRKIGEEKIA